MLRNSTSSTLSKKLLYSAIALALLLPGSSEARRHKRSIVDDAAAAAEDAVAASLTKTPEDLEVCFSPDEHCDRKIVKFVDSAKTSLDIAIYDINLGSLVNAIIKKSKEIPVRMVVDRSQAKTPKSAVPKLIAAGVKIRFGTQRGHGIMHNKFVIVDGKILETGSYNETNGASFSNNENQLYLAHPKIVERYRKRFEEIWSRGKAVSF